MDTCVYHLLQPIRLQAEDGETYQTSEGAKQCKLFLAMYLGDKMEMCLAARKKLANFAKLKNPCFVCQVTGEELDNFNLS